jgi:hypothetical protein
MLAKGLDPEEAHVQVEARLSSSWNYGSHLPSIAPNHPMSVSTTTSWIKYDKNIRLPFGIPAPAVSFLECHFEFSPPTEPADVFACLFHDEPVSDWRSYESSTRLIDLRSDLDRLFADFSKDTRYEINRANKRDGVETSIFVSPTETQLDEFMNYYDAFAASKGVRRIHRAQLRALGKARKVVLSVARGADGAILASHAYVLSHARARLTHSASLYRLEQGRSERAQIGRANRLLHWNDLVALRAVGASWYDFGGWYQGSHDEALLRINAYKKDFGGEIVREWSSFHSGSRVGSLYLTLRHVLLRRKS